MRPFTLSSIHSFTQPHPMSHLFSIPKDFNLLGLILWLVDILAVAWLIYRLLLLAKGTRATQIIFGLMVFFLLVLVSDRLKLYALHWLLRQAFPLGPVAL